MTGTCTYPIKITRWLGSNVKFIHKNNSRFLCSIKYLYDLLNLISVLYILNC